MKRKIKTALIFVLISINTILLYRYVSISNKEITDVNLYTDYFEASVIENGGFVVLDENFYSFSKTYEFEPDKKSQISSKKTVTINKYKVVSGDNLDKISKKMNVSVDTIKINNPSVRTGKLKAGETLNIPSEDGFFYKIKKGDYLIKVAQRYKIKLTDITDYNDIEPKKIALGMEIFLKGVDYKRYMEIENPPKPAQKNKTTASSKGGSKKVQNDAVTNPKITASGGSSGFAFPVRYVGVSSPFGNRYHPVLKKYILHTGVDLIAKFVPLRASKAGTVTFAGYMSGYGKIIIIKHSDGYETRYAHLSVISTKVGEHVNKGDLIGKTGNSGRVTGAHLHFEIRKNGVPKNPMSYLK